MDDSVSMIDGQYYVLVHLSLWVNQKKYYDNSMELLSWFGIKK